MFFSNWFQGKKSRTQASHAAAGKMAERAHMAAEMARQANLRSVESLGETDEDAASAPQARKSERLARREQLYGVVRNCMVRSGVLNSGYKFKVLSLDPKGRQFLVMIDVQHSYVKDVGRLSEIEALIMERAKSHFEMVVTAVYWRLSDYAEFKKSQAAHEAAHAAQPARAIDPDALHDEELLAFQRALHTGLETPLDHEQAALEGLRQKARQAGYADTEMSDRETPVGGLGATQYGDIR